jgi:SAM-dependent methyltransferase
MPSAGPVLTAPADGQVARSDQGAAVSALDGLAEELAKIGYGEFLACFDPFVLSLSAWRAARACVPPSLGPVVDLFLLGNAVSPVALPSGLRDLVPGLGMAGLLQKRADDLVDTMGIVVLRVLGSWLACQPPQANPLFYLGEDSLALLGRLTPGAARTCLDLCAGPGVHAVHCARFAPSVTAVERDPRIARLAELNARLNGLAGRVDVLAGDLYEPVAGYRFDLIAANPPTLPYPADLPGPRIGHGGDDGLQMTWRVLHGLPDALTDRGRAHLVGMTLTDGRPGRLGERLAAVARDRDLAIRCSVICHSPLSPGDRHLERLVTVVAAIADCHRDQVRESYAGLLDRLGASHLSTYFLQVGLGSGKLELTDVSRPGREGLWHA